MNHLPTPIIRNPSSTKRIAIAPCLAVALLAGCASVPEVPRVETAAPALQALRTSDPDEIRRRFGDYENLAGQQYIGNGKNPVTLREWTWSVPSVQLRAKGLDCYESTGKCNTVSYIVQFDPAQRRLLFVGDDQRVFQTGMVTAEGAVAIQRGQTAVKFSFDYDTGEVVNGSFDRWTEIGRQDYAKLTSSWEESDAEVRREERLARRRESEENARAVLGAIQAFSQSYVDTAQSYARQQAERSASARAVQQMALAREAAARQRAAAESASRARSEALSRQIARPTSTQLAVAPLVPLPQAPGQPVAVQRATQAPATAPSRAVEAAQVRPVLPQQSPAVDAAVAPRTPVAQQFAGVQSQSSAGRPQTSADVPEKVEAPSRGPAKAWCYLTRNDGYRCWGPLQKNGWGKSLEGALSMVGCPGGSGYEPKVGAGGSSFDCGRPLRGNELVMPDYDPFYNRDKALN